MPGSSKRLWTPFHQNQLPLLFLVIISPFVLHMVYGFDEVMVSYIGNCFCVKTSSVRRNYGTLSLALENNSGQTCTIKNSF